MNKTRVDDMLIEMITPKIKEIEEKFSAGKGLNQEDINTLLLKSQYNHINHLDSKLNEVTASVVALESRFDDKFNKLESRFDNKFNKLESRFVGLENKFNKLESRFVGLENKFVGLENKFVGLENKFELLHEQIEHTIQKALNKNMVMLMAMMGFFLTLSKALDIFAK
jgi:chromosome segregation ATPase